MYMVEECGNRNLGQKYRIMCLSLLACIEQPPVRMRSEGGL